MNLTENPLQLKLKKNFVPGNTLFNCQTFSLNRPQFLLSLCFGFKLQTHLNEVVAAVLFVLKLKVDKAQVDVLALSGLDDPVAVLLVVVVHVPELGVGEELGGRVLGGQVAPTHGQVLRHEALQ